MTEKKLLMRCVIPGRPVPWQRTRGPNRHTEPKYQAWKEAAQWILATHRDIPTTPVLHGVVVHVTVGTQGVVAEFYHPDLAPTPHNPNVQYGRPKHVRGDIDNYLKAVLDSANGVVYRDDRQVVAAYARFAI